ncbi:Ragulator complex Rag GEF subunit [Schizosaccharomyces pombe]|uniref:Uncharacterized protein C1778.05c n=2 Tax=cellular organisms TaxID=131567 RepID=YOI5_SCHPO|nr:uncharacterized protein SPBC1778.05c [Schizosaccharomyces pombe]Q9Y7J2.2 RecName: Full=Uncharacterized protein C1778.05c [Schizosaccharomyces pombe 972h-]CAB39800.2 sequence orphan [Schizosaccharomyces pombe]|eukprot:NP_596288.2 uncharacterized protein SPBC1778.05c [Schizosaccharomyces pombe]
MIKPKKLSSLMKQAVEETVPSIMVFTTTGSLLAYVSFEDPKDGLKRLDLAKRVRSIAALAGNMYSLYTATNPSPLVAESTDDVIAHQRDVLFETIIEFERGKLLIAAISIDGAEDKLYSKDPLLLGIVGTENAKEGMMQIKSELLKECITNELSTLGKPV